MEQRATEQRDGFPGPQHTPGPWIAHETETRTAIKRGRQVVAYVNIGADQDYNAALIAAAPDLLALAHQYASECGECSGTGLAPDGNGGDEPCPDEYCQRARAVIARAEGRA